MIFSVLLYVDRLKNRRWGLRVKFKKYFILLSLCAIAIIGAGCEDNAGRDSSNTANSSGNSQAGTAVQINHRTPHTLAESFIKAVIAGDFDAVYKMLSPDCRLRLDDFLTKENESRENWMARLQNLWKVRLGIDDLNLVLSDNELYSNFEKLFTKDESMFIQLNGKWYLVFK